MAKILRETQEMLAGRLRAIGWEERLERYASAIRGVHGYTGKNARCSIVIIAVAPGHASLETLLALKAQDADAQIIFVSNGSENKWAKLMARSADVFVMLRENYGAYMARNIGSVFGTAPVLLFVDDDAVPEPGFVDAHVAAFSLYTPITVRGKVAPLTASPLNMHAGHYDLGDRPLSYYPDTEGNMAANTKIFFEVGGWYDDIVFGHGGVELSLRIMQRYPQRERQIYIPFAVIRHDYSSSEEHLHKKWERQKQGWLHLVARHGDIHPFLQGWKAWNNSAEGRAFADRLAAIFHKAYGLP